MPPFFGAELGEDGGVAVIKGRGACDTKVLIVLYFIVHQQNELEHISMKVDERMEG